MPTREQWLNQGFLLTDDPFEPVRDPLHGLDLRAKRVNFSRWLNIFSLEELADYFEQVGSFATAVQDVSDFLTGQGNSIDTGTPPVLLIEGAGGTGRKTFGSFTAHLMKAHCVYAPSFRVLKVNTDHTGRLLFEVKMALEEHFKGAGLDAAPLKSRDTFIKPEDPDETVLAGLFNAVAQQNLGPPLLILLIGILEFKNFEWIKKLYGMLKDLNVALIFVTNDNLVTQRFGKALGRGEYIGCAVTLEPLTIQDGTTLLTNRLTTFRQGRTAPPGPAALTPYEAAAIQWIFSGGQERRAINFLLNLCRFTMNRKLDDLAQSKTAETKISAEDVRKAYEKSLQQKGWGGQK